LTIGCINPDGKPGIATVYPDGSFDLENISTMGVGAPFAELILRDVDVGQLDADTAVYLVGVIIAKVSLVHAQVNGVTGGMDVFEVTSREPKIVKKISIEEFIKILELQRALSFKDYLNKLKDVLKKIET
jgi:20S proteasome alpha/beta subunit